METAKPIYGMNRGSVGFLMNEYSEYGLPERLAAALPSIIHPLLMRARDIHGVETTARAINEVSLLRQVHQAAKLRIEIDDATRLGELVADGVLVATPAEHGAARSGSWPPDRGQASRTAATSSGKGNGSGGARPKAGRAKLSAAQPAMATVMTTSVPGRVEPR